MQQTQAETAEVLETTPGTVATHVHRGVKTLRVTLGAFLGVVFALFTAAWARTGTLPIDPAATGHVAARMERWVTRWGWPEAFVAVLVGGSLTWLAYTLLHGQYLRLMSRLRGRQAAALGTEQSSVDWQGEDWIVRQVAGTEGNKTYRCPGCTQTIPASVAHVVVWPTTPDVEDRRHWHRTCWNAQDRRNTGTREPRTAPSAERRY